MREGEKRGGGGEEGERRTGKVALVCSEYQCRPDDTGGVVNLNRFDADKESVWVSWEYVK